MSKTKTSVSKFSIQEEEKKVREEFSNRYEDVVQSSQGLASAPSSSPSPSSDNVGPNAYSDLPLLPFEDDNQRVILLNIAHRNQIPKSKVPAFRICGAFENIDRLKRHVASVGGAPSYGNANLLKADAHKKFLICSSLEKQQNSNYVMKKIDEITTRYVSTINFHNEEFKQNKESRKQGKTGLSQKERMGKKVSSRKLLMDKMFEESSAKGNETGEVMRNAEVRKQAVAVVSIIEDPTPAALNGLEDPEPVVIIWGCFEDDKQAKHYIYNTASKKVKDLMLDIVNMYEWIYPYEVSKRVEEIEEEHRNPTLDKMMKSRKQQKAKVLSYEEFCKKEQQTAPVLEITATKAREEDEEVKTEVHMTETPVAHMTVSTRHKTDEKAEDPVDLSECKDWKVADQVTSHDEKYNDTIFLGVDKVQNKTTKTTTLLPIQTPSQTQTQTSTSVTSTSPSIPTPPKQGTALPLPSQSSFHPLEEPSPSQPSSADTNKRRGRPRKDPQMFVRK